MYGHYRVHLSDGNSLMMENDGVLTVEHDTNPYVKLRFELTQPEINSLARMFALYSKESE